MLKYPEFSSLEEFTKDKKLSLILACISRSFKTAEQISIDCNVSITTVYRKLKILEENQFLEKSGKITKKGKIRYFRKKPTLDFPKILIDQNKHNFTKFSDS